MMMMMMMMIVVMMMMMMQMMMMMMTCVCSPKERAPSAGVSTVDESVASQQEVNHWCVPLPDHEQCHHRHHHHHDHIHHHCHHHPKEKCSRFIIIRIEIDQPHALSIHNIIMTILTNNIEINKIIKNISTTINTLKHDEAVGSPQHQQSESAKV